MWRAGFGPAASQLNELATATPASLYHSLQKTSAPKPAFIDTADASLKKLLPAHQQEGPRKAELDKADRKTLQQWQRQSLKNLNLAWLNTMVQSEAQLREKMAFFWHGHFASRNINIFFQQQLLDVIRQNALGSFRELLHGVSKTAAMLNFLNNNQNRKDHPNENFAREVMELFTMGRGHYTEQDVKEAARAFTGWGATLQGDFVFRRFLHDNGAKTVLGKTGNFDGDDVLDILLEQKQTARFITQKIYKFFVNDSIDNDKAEWLAVRFYNSGYNISKLMEDIFNSDWFYDEKNIGAKIKSPVELLAGIQRMLPMQIANEPSLLLLQRILGQVLFYPPNVAGWPGGKTWIDSSTLMMRLRIPQLLTATDELNVTPKTDDDQMGGRSENEEATTVMTGSKKAFGRIGRPINATVNWSDYAKHFDNVSGDQLLHRLSSTLLQPQSSLNKAVLNKYVDSSSRENFIKTATIQLMSTPEYQMC